jgi:hypothetical protein
MKTIIYLFFLYLIGACTGLSAQTNYFVSSKGSDKNNGSFKSPFRTIEKAQQKAREVNGEAIIILRGGEYRLTKPLLFTSQDGNENKRLTLRSYSNERVVISGGILLNPEWKPYRDGIMQATINVDFPVDMLLADGEIRHQARFPNFDSTAVRFYGVSADATSSSRVKNWKNPVGGYLHAMHWSDWGDFHYRITGKDDEGNLSMEGGWQNNRQSGLSRNNRMVENIFEELDAPGEWYYESQESVLYYFPMPDEDINSVKFEVASLKHLVELRGCMENPVRNISIEGIEFTQTARTFMEEYEPLLRSDWMIYRGGGIVFEGTEDCSLHNCYLHNLGGNAVFFSNYNRRSTISGSYFTRIGASAVCFVGDPKAVRSPSFEYNESVPLEQMDRTIGPKTDNYPAHCLVYDNLIHKIGLFEKQTTGVELSMCQFITVSHNSIYDTPRAGINVSEGTWGGHVIEYNDIFNTVKETGDHGSFNSWGRDRFWHPDRRMMDTLVENHPALILADATATTVIRNNRFRCDRGWDIDLDDGSSNYHIYNNLCLNGGIKLREGFYRVVENNILINNTFHPHVWFRNNGDVFARNIVMTPYLPVNIPEWGVETDFNIFTDSLAYNVARKNKTDRNSIVHHVNFIDPQNGNYCVANSDYKVFRLGFQNFDMNNFGVISQRLRLLAQTPKFSFPVINKEVVETDIVLWQGLRIKNLQTLGERSATGMDSERGVYVISVVDHYTPLNDFLQANDVILKFADIDVDNVTDFLELLKQADLTHTHRMVIFRNQSEKVISIPGNTIKGIACKYQ